MNRKRAGRSLRQAIHCPLAPPPQSQAKPLLRSLRQAMYRPLAPRPPLHRNPPHPTRQAIHRHLAQQPSHPRRQAIHRPLAQHPPPRRQSGQPKALPNTRASPRKRFAGRNPYREPTAAPTTFPTSISWRLPGSNASTASTSRTLSARPCRNSLQNTHLQTVYAWATGESGPCLTTLYKSRVGKAHSFFMSSMASRCLILACSCRFSTFALCAVFMAI